MADCSANMPSGIPISCSGLDCQFLILRDVAAAVWDCVVGALLLFAVAVCVAV